MKRSRRSATTSKCRADCCAPSSNQPSNRPQTGPPMADNIETDREEPPANIIQTLPVQTGNTRNSKKTASKKQKTVPTQTSNRNESGRNLLIVWQRTCHKTRPQRLRPAERHGNRRRTKSLDGGRHRSAGNQCSPRPTDAVAQLRPVRRNAKRRWLGNIIKPTELITTAELKTTAERPPNKQRRQAKPNKNNRTNDDCPEPGSKTKLYDSKRQDLSPLQF